MRITAPITVLVATALLFGAGCKKKEKPEEETAVTAAPAPPPPPPPTATAAPGPGPGEVQHYPDEVQMGAATVELLQPFTVHQAADLTSAVIAHVGRGELINIKATHSNWMLIEYPSAVATMSPGWIDLRNIYDPRVRMRHGQPALPARLPGGRDPRDYRPGGRRR